jgi:hypothetical protein
VAGVAGRRWLFVRPKPRIKQNHTMKKNIALIFATGTLFLAGCCTTHREPASTATITRPETAPTKWEYMTVVDSEASGDKLSQLGEQGWEVISFNPYAGVDGSRHIICLLKRPKQ